MAKIAILVEKVYEDLELQYPRLRLKEAGHTVDVIGPKAGDTFVGKHGYPQKSRESRVGGEGVGLRSDRHPRRIIPRPYAADEGMVKLVRDAAAKKIPMAAICHGPWMLCSTDALQGPALHELYVDRA